MSTLFRRVLYFNRHIALPAAVVVTCLLMQSCGKKDFSRLPSIGKDHLFMMVVEIPAGKNKKTEFNPTTKEFETNQVNGSDRIIDFLAYPCNYGFIPSTMQNKAEGGDGDPLDVMLISESIPTGSVVKIIPVAVLHLTDNGETDDKIIAIPADPFARTINAIDYSSLSTRYPSIIQIIELWLQNYKGTGIIQPVKWGDEADATSTIIKSGTDKQK
jgi:inorganic pyrophosphatase